MFSNRGKDTPPAAPASSMNALAAAPRNAARAGVPSIISADLIVTGTLTSTGDVQIDGRVDGDVRSHGLVIGEKAEVHGEILADNVTVRGKVIGRIRARKVQLSATSHVEGDILHETFAVEAGAFFEGNCRHSDNPLGDPVEARRPAPVTAAPQIVSTPAPSNARADLAGLAPLAPATSST